MSIGCHIDDAHCIRRGTDGGSKGRGEERGEEQLSKKEV